MNFILILGTTHTARIPGISAAGATPTLMQHTPVADAELLEYGRPVTTPHVPVSPTGCPTPALITRAVRELIGFKTQIITTGLTHDPATQTTSISTNPGKDIRDPTPVPDATQIFSTARDIGTSLPDTHLMIAESIPGGTTTALGILTALGEPFSVSSSLQTNPLEQKHSVVTEALNSSGLDPGACTDSPLDAIQLMGDPVQAAVSGLTLGALETDRHVTLAGGTQMIASAAILRHLGNTTPLHIATTPFVADDNTTDIHAAAESLNVELHVTDPMFNQVDHPVMTQYQIGEAKEGVGMGGALMLASQSTTSMEQVHDRIIRRYEAVLPSNGS